MVDITWRTNSSDTTSGICDASNSKVGAPNSLKVIRKQSYC